MKIRNSAILAAIGVILTGFPRIINFFISFIKSPVPYTFINTIGNTLIFLFFYMFASVQKEASETKSAGVLGLVGYLIVIILNVTGMISTGIFHMSIGYSMKYVGLISMAAMFSRANLILGLIPIVLIFICFMSFYKNFNKNRFLKKTALLAAIGQIISLVEWIMNIILFMPIFDIMYEGAGTKGLNIINAIVSIIGLIPLVFLFIFFIALYRELNSNENSVKLQEWLIEYK